MAFAKLKVTEINRVSEFSTPKTTSEMYTALTEGVTDSDVYGAYLEMTERDDKYIIIVSNTNSSATAPITIKAGNGLFSGADLTYSEIPASSKTAIAIESGRFKWMTDNGGYIDKTHTDGHGVDGLSEKGKVFFTTSKGGVSICVLRQPV